MPFHIPPDSGAPYIIICSTRINIAVESSEVAKIKAASDGAAQLASFMESHYKQFDKKDLLPISTLQHELMDYLLGELELTPEQVTIKRRALISEMYKLEKKYQ